MTNEEKKLNEAIKQDGINTQSEILDKLKRRYPQYVEQSNSDKEIEMMAELLAHSIGNMTCGERARYLSYRGIGDKKQAVKEFVDKLEKYLYVNMYNNDTASKLARELFTELYGANE